MIEINKIYKLKDEFLKELNIPEQQWNRRKNDLLDWLNEFYDYEIINTRPVKIIVKEIYQEEYTPMPRTNDRAQKLIDYTEFTKSRLTSEYKPTVKKRLAEEAIREFGKEKYQHKSALNVSRNYISPALEECADCDDVFVWVWRKTLEPLPWDILQDWNQIRKERKADFEDQLTGAEEEYYDADNKEMNTFISRAAYVDAMTDFQKKYGDLALRVKSYKLKDKYIKEK